ncbi:MAG: class I SAM-dependent methyltransferase [Chloroflexi bacterium]|nr:class I SAM-dependent methyltransferase [Chloroflexota bacterium]
MRKLAFWGALVAAAAGTRWVLEQRPRQRVPDQTQDIPPEVYPAYGRITSLPHFRAIYGWQARRTLWNVPLTGAALDIGCGPGHLTAQLARLSPGLRLVGLDLAPEMLRLASHTYGDADGRLTWQQGQAEALPFPDRHFDLVVSSFSLHEWAEPVCVFDEIARVLKPGGRFAIFDSRRDMAAPAWLLLWLAQRLVVPTALADMDEPTGSVRAAYTPRELVALAQRSQLPPWRVASGFFWLSLENANTP